MNNLKRISLFCTVILMTVLFSCQEGGNNNSACSSDFDQGAMFTDLSDLISNKYTSASTDIASLKSAINTFTASPDATNLASTRLAFENAYLSFVATEPYLFGPAQENDLVKELNSFPVNSALLEANINSGSYNLDAPDNFYSGFPALDYLLYGVGMDDNSIMNKYSTDTNSAGYIQYITDVINKMDTDIQIVNTAWSNSYKNTFINNKGTAAGTSLSEIINGLNENFEQTKRNRIGTPSGQLTLGQTFPQNVEAFYSGLSLRLLKKNLESSKEFFQGASQLSLDDYLNEVNAEKNGSLLSTEIINQYNSAITAVNNIPEPLSASVDGNPAEVLNAYTIVTSQVVNLKTDMPTKLCVSITYLDNPSDSD